MKLNSLADMINNGEEKYLTQLQQIVLDILLKNRRLVLLSGPSGSGKTTTATLIVEKLRNKGKKAIYLSMDNWFKTKSDYVVPKTEDGKDDFESPFCVDIDILNKDLRDLLAGKEVELPKYDFVNQKMYYDGDFVTIDANTVIVVEGLHALNSFIDIDRTNSYRIFVKPLSSELEGVFFTDEDIRLYRRINRDKLHRGRTIEDTLHMLSSVSRGEQLYLNPTIKDIDFNVDSFMPYELYLHKTYLGDFQKLSSLTDIKIGIEDIPSKSLLEEFYK